MLDSAKGLFLTDEPRPMWKYILWMAPIGFVPSVVLGALGASVGLVSDSTGLDAKDFQGVPILGVVFLILIVSPVVETLLMSPILFLISRATKKKLTIAIVSALIWGVFHGLASPVWGLVVLWPFFVFSCAYLTWRPKSWVKAIWVTCCIHMLQNTLPALAFVVLLST